MAMIACGSIPAPASASTAAAYCPSRFTVAGLTWYSSASRAAVG